MKEVILTMAVMVPDDFDDLDLSMACNEQLESGWRFDKAQRVVIDRSGVDSDAFVIGFTPHKIVVGPSVTVESEIYND